jgi:hypothetical protein
MHLVWFSLDWPKPNAIYLSLVANGEISFSLLKFSLNWHKLNAIKFSLVANVLLFIKLN